MAPHLLGTAIAKEKKSNSSRAAGSKPNVLRPVRSRDVSDGQQQLFAGAKVMLEIESPKHVEGEQQLTVEDLEVHLYYTKTDQLHGLLQQLLGGKGDLSPVDLDMVKDASERWVAEIRKLVEPVRQSNFETYGILTTLLKFVDEFGLELPLSEGMRHRLAGHLNAARAALRHEKHQDFKEHNFSNLLIKADLGSRA